MNGTVMEARANLTAARALIAASESKTRRGGSTSPFGDVRLDSHLAGGGLPLGRWHEVGGEGLDLETAAAAGAFTALLVAPLTRRGEVVWILRRDDLFAPGLEGLGLDTSRLIQVCARDEAEALAALEDALAAPGVAAAVAELDAVSLTAGRRLQLACERGGATGFAIARRPFGGGRRMSGGSVAATRWRIAPAPSVPAPGEPGLGPPRWTVTLERSRGGRPGAWVMEARQDLTDDAHPLAVVSELADHGLAAPQSPASPLSPAVVRPWRMAG